jgi:hypothetical protein
VAQVNAQAWIARRDLACSSERAYGSLRVTTRELRTAEIHPIRELAGSRGHRALELCHRKRICAFIKRSPTTLGFRQHATHLDQEQQTQESLTRTARAATIARMTREVLLSILRDSPAFSEKAGAFKVQAEHRVTFYLGTDGRGIVVHDVTGLTARDGHVEIAAPEPGTIYAAYDYVHALAVKPPKDSALKKAGFA